MQVPVALAPPLRKYIDDFLAEVEGQLHSLNHIEIIINEVEQPVAREILSLGFIH